MPSVVFVHGINSSCESAFSTMAIRFRDDRAFAGWEMRFFDYDYNDSIARNGERLREYLERKPPGEKIVIVAHSMGGLVARVACLTTGTPSRARRLIMLATPNRGALNVLQLTLLAQNLVGAVTTLGVYARKPGYKDLTRVSKMFEKLSKEERLKRTTTEYVTIGATYFHPLRDDDEFPPFSFGNWHTRFGVLNATSLLSNALRPLLAFSLQKPHDGIVELRSVELFPPEPGKWSGYASEQMDSIKAPEPSQKTYADVWQPALDSLHHVNVTSEDEEIMDLVKSLVLADSLPEWIEDAPSVYGLQLRT